MMLTLHTEFTFSSAHHLEGYDGQCAKVHGHEWLCEVWFKGDQKFINQVGLLVDFGIVKKVKLQLDHEDLNKVLHFNPTAEQLSIWIYNYLRKLVRNEAVSIKVRLYESFIEKKCWCECGDDDI